MMNDASEDRLSTEFDKHWDENAAVEYPVQKLHEARRFLQPLLQHIQATKNKQSLHVLDAGTGDGIHARVLADAGDIDYVGLDVSLSALLKIQSTVIPASLVQGDVVSMPFPDQTFDATFSFGVLGYSSDPARAFAEMCRVTRVGGMIGVWLFPKKTGLAGAAFGSVRWLCGLTGSWGTYALANAIVPFLFFLPTRSKVHLLNSSWKQCLEVVLVNIQPTMLYFPTREIVLQWFSENSIEVIAEDSSEPITLWGVKR